MVIEVSESRSRTPGLLLSACLFSMLVLAAMPGSTYAQEGDAAAALDTTLSLGQRPLATRAELEARLETLQNQTAEAPGETPATIRRRIDTIRERLRKGDFRVGDLVELQVRQDESLRGTFPVNRQRELELPTLPPVSLEGVLYSEIEGHLQEALGEYLRDPTVRARALWRIAVVGGVSKPGFYDLSPATTLSDALMRAGGPTQRAKLEELEFRRGENDLLKSRDVPVETITLAELHAQRGDQLYVPQGGQGLGWVRIMGIVSGLTGTAWAIARIF